LIGDTDVSYEVWPISGFGMFEFDSTHELPSIQPSHNASLAKQPGTRNLKYHIL